MLSRQKQCQKIELSKAHRVLESMFMDRKIQLRSSSVTSKVRSNSKPRQDATMQKKIGDTRKENPELSVNVKPQQTIRRSISKPDVERYPLSWNPTSDNDGQNSYFLKLPQPIRVKILKYLSPVERIMIQLVCRRLRNEMRHRVGIMAHVDEKTKLGLTSYRDIIVDTVIVGRYDRPNFNPTKLLIQPENVRLLVFEWAILLPYFDAFLVRCRHLTRLHIHAPIVSGMTPQPSINKGYLSVLEWRHQDTIYRYGTPLNHLKELVVCLPSAGCSLFLKEILNVVNAPNLRRLNVRVNGDIDLTDTASVHFSVIEFLVKSAKIQCLLISTEQGKESLKVQGSQHLGLQTAKLLRISGNIELKELVLTESVVIFNSWTVMLSAQNRLRVLQVLHATSWPTLKSIICTNANTLTKIAIHCLVCDRPGTQVDLNVFMNCKRLQELCMFIAAADASLTECINFHQLPKSLETLSLKNCAFKTREILEVTELPKLKSLGIVSYGNVRNYGITIPVLKRFLNMRKLDELLISGFCVTQKHTAELVSIIEKTGAQIKEKRSTFYFRGLGPNHWTITKQGNLIFNVLSDWILIH